MDSPCDINEIRRQITEYLESNQKKTNKKLKPNVNKRQNLNKREVSNRRKSNLQKRKTRDKI